MQVPDPTPLEEALSALSERFVTIRLARESWQRELQPVIAAAKAEAVEPLVKALSGLLAAEEVSEDENFAGWLKEPWAQAVHSLDEARRALPPAEEDS